MISCEPGCTHEDHMEEYLQAVTKVATAAEMDVDEVLKLIKAAEDIKPPKEEWAVVPNRADRRKAKRDNRHV